MSIKLPNIFPDDCPPPDQGVSTCQDERCADPAFALANPLLCKDTPQLIIKPEVAMVCAPCALQFAAFVRTGAAGEVALTEGLVFSSSNTAALVIDSATGSATAVAASIVTVSVTWQSLVAYAQVTVGASGDCCADTVVKTVIVEDVSNSMSQPYGPTTKIGAAYQSATCPLNAILHGNTKDSWAIVTFSDSATEKVDFTGDLTALLAGLVGASGGGASGSTQLLPAIQMALEMLGDPMTNVQRAIYFISDGNNEPAISAADLQTLLNVTDGFKAGGGIIICIGIRASGDGYTLLQRIASGGFFLNRFVTDPAGDVAQLAWMKAVEANFCGGACPPCGDDRTGYDCPGEPLGQQQPDPNPLPLIEGGGGTIGGGPQQKLPPVNFSPVSGTSVGSGLSVSLSVPSHPGAHIRFTMTTDGSIPPDPNFTNPSDPSTGLDYDGQNVPIVLTSASSGVVRIKAIGRETGFVDSDIREADYPQGAGNNTLPLIWQQDATVPMGGAHLAKMKGTPYPSVKVVSGLSGVVTSAKVVIKNWLVQTLEPKAILLEAPGGTKVLLAYFDTAGNNLVAPGAVITFDDAAPNFLPESTSFGPVVQTGSYKPTAQAGGASVNFPSPAPASPYAITLSAFNGIAPNGSWNLWIMHINWYTRFGQNEAIEGWDLVLTTA